MVIAYVKEFHNASQSPVVLPSLLCVSKCWKEKFSHSTNIYESSIAMVLNVE